STQLASERESTVLELARLREVSVQTELTRQTALQEEADRLAAEAEAQRVEELLAQERAAEQERQAAAEEPEPSGSEPVPAPVPAPSPEPTPAPEPGPTPAPEPEPGPTP